MISSFQHQQSGVFFSFSVTAPSTTGEFGFGLGCSGLSGPTLGFIGRSGELFLENGSLIGSYSQGEEFSASGYFYDQTASLFLGDSLVATNISCENQGVNYAYLTGEGASIFSQINGSLKPSGLSLNYITSSSGDESGIIGLLEGMTLFDTVVVSEDTYSGTLTGQDITGLNQYDLIVMGFEQTLDNFSGASGWDQVTAPIIFLEPEIASQNYANIISGVAICSSERTGYCTSVLDSSFERTNFSGTGNAIELFNSLGSGEGDIFYFNISGSPSSMELVTGLYEKNFMSRIPAGTGGWTGAYTQSGQRTILTVLKTGDYDSVYDTLSDEWKKILISEVYNLV